MALEMIRYNTTGEIRVIDAENMVASEFLGQSDQNAPLSDYDLGCELAASDLIDYTVVRSSDDEPDIPCEITDPADLGRN